MSYPWPPMTTVFVPLTARLRASPSIGIEINISYLGNICECMNTRGLPADAFICNQRTTRRCSGECAISHIFTIIWIKLLIQSFLFISPCMDAPYVWDHISEGKACIKNPKTCGPSKWPPLTTGMSYSCGPSVSIEKPHDKQRTQDLHIS